MPTKAQSLVRGKTKVFLSYSRTDLDLAQAIRAGLESAQDIELLQDVRDVSRGERWDARVIELIALSDRVLFIASPASILSEECVNELEAARTAGKLVLPVLIEGVNWRQVPAVASKIHGFEVDPKDPQSMEALIAALRTEILANVYWVRQNTRYHELAHRWVEGGRRGTDLLRGNRLRELRKWLAETPPKGEEPSPLLFSFLERGTFAAWRRRAWFVIVSLLVAVVATVAALLALFYDADTTVSAGGVALEEGDLARAQALFVEWGAKPTASLLPVSPTANRLATRLLNTGLVVQTYQLADALKPGEEISRYYSQDVSLVHTSQSIFALYPIEQNIAVEGGEPEAVKPHILVRCALDLSSCTQTRLDPHKGVETEFLVMDNAVFLSFEAVDGVRQFASLPDTAPLEAQPVADSATITRLSAIASATDEADLSSDPILSRAESPDEAGPTKFFSDETVYNAVCTGDLGNCVMQFMRDARGTVYTYDLWSFSSSETGESLDGAPSGWNLVTPAFYVPPMTRNSMSLSSDGELLAISADRRVSMWSTTMLHEQQAAPLKQIDLGADIVGLTFGRDRTLLYAATQRGLMLVNVDPRIAAFDTRPLELAPPFTSDDEIWNSVDLLGGKLIATYEACALKLSGYPNLKETISLPDCTAEGPVSDLGVLASSDHRAVVAVNYGGESAPQIVTVSLALRGSTIQYQLLESIEGAVDAAWEDDTIGLNANRALGVIAAGTTATTYSIVDDEVVVDHLALPTAIDGSVLPLIRATEDAFILVATSERCKAEDGVLVTFLMRVGSALEPRFESCVAGFPTMRDANAKVGVVANDPSGRIFLGSYDFDGFMEWNPQKGTLAVWRTSSGDKDHVERKVVATEANDAPQGPIIITNGSDLDDLILTDGTVSGDSGTLAFYFRRGGSLGSAYGVTVLDFATGDLRQFAPPSSETFDYVDEVILSPNGSLLFVGKESSGYSLFDLDTDGSIPVPEDTVDASFATDGAMSISLPSGSRVCWSVPEGIDAHSAFLTSSLSGIEQQVPCDGR